MSEPPNTLVDAFLVLASPPPEFDKAAATRILHDQYGIEGTLKTLVSERDQNFLAAQASGESFILKITNSAEAVEVTDFQTDALLHIADVDADFPVPRIIRTIDGGATTTVFGEDGRQHVARVLTCLDGVPLRYVDPRPDNARQLGEYLARLGVALQDFTHPASDYSLLWDLKRAASLIYFLEHVKDQVLLGICRERIEQFTDHTAPVLNTLRSQVIHNDLHSSNVLVDSSDPNRITGVIDFGDVVNSPLIVDVAVAAAYLVDDTEEPLVNIVKFLDGYSGVRRLQEMEIDLLYDLIVMRNVMTIVIAHWRAAQYPENREYILLDVEDALKTIERLTRLGRSKASDAFHKACVQ